MLQLGVVVFIIYERKAVTEPTRKGVTDLEKSWRMRQTVEGNDGGKIRIGITITQICGDSKE